MNKVIGSEVKLKLSVTNIDSCNLEDCDFDVIFYADAYEADKTNTNFIYHVFKDSMRKIDANTYTCLVDSSKTGTGIIRLLMTIYVPDADAQNEDHKRREIIRGVTDVNIIN